MQYLNLHGRIQDLIYFQQQFDQSHFNLHIRIKGNIMMKEN